MNTTTTQLALLGGPKTIPVEPEDIFTWPIVTKEDEEAVLQVLRAGAMSGTEITEIFEKEYAAYNGTKYALAFCNGTSSLHSSLWACGVGAGDEVICPSVTFWASCTAALSLGAALNFAEIQPDTLCIDPNDIEHRIGPRTKVIIVVHYNGYPCDMDRIMPIARKHGVKVLEDVSHAHGTLYKGRMAGTIGDIAGMSMMSVKSLAIGEGGMMVTNDHHLYERCVAYGHYERTGVRTRFGTADSQVTDPDLSRYAGIPLGGFKHRMHQLSSAMGRVQLKYYPERMARIQDGMNHFWDLLDGVPGLRAQRPPKDSGSTMGGWYNPHGLYRSEELGGLSCAKFCEAVKAEGFSLSLAGANYPLHTHPVFHTADIFNMGKPTMISFGQRDVRQGEGTLPVAESIEEISYHIPYFKHDDSAIIAQYANAYRKVAEHADELL